MFFHFFINNLFCVVLLLLAAGSLCVFVCVFICFVFFLFCVTVVRFIRCVCVCLFVVRMASGLQGCVQHVYVV
jgi:hypothetical protein